MDREGMMSPQSMDLALRTVSRFVDIARSMRVSGIKAVATAAVRDAANGPDFKNAVERQWRDFASGALGHGGGQAFGAWNPSAPSRTRTA